MVDIYKATLCDMPYIIDLANKEGNSIGFIPKIAYESAITGEKSSINRWSKTCNDKLWIAKENNEPVGFLLATFGDIVKVNQICLQKDARKLERGRLLIDTLREHSHTLNKHNFGCGCADDLESNLFWQAMGWQKIGQRFGINYTNTWKQTSDRVVNLYRYYELQGVLL